MRKILIAAFLFTLPQSALASNSDEQCLAKAVYYEAKAESYKGKQAVAHVVLNRVKSRKFSNTICGVVYQRGQFSWVGHEKKITETHNWNTSLEVADSALNHLSSDPTGGALYFWSTRIKIPKHARNKARIQIGGHYFAK